MAYAADLGADGLWLISRGLAAMSTNVVLWELIWILQTAYESFLSVVTLRGTLDRRAALE